MMKRGRWIVLAVVGIALAGALTACGGCDTPTGSCEDLPDMGFIRVLVLDQEGAPIPNVTSCASLGSNSFACAFTQSDGVMEHPVPVGMRRTWIAESLSPMRPPFRPKPPEGYVQGSDPLEQVVEVVKDRTTQVEFRLVRTA